MGGWVYILANRKHGTLYVGVTSDIARRSFQHRDGITDGFTKRYRVYRLVWIERHDTIADAIAREKALKKRPSAWKVELIERDNPDWHDLYKTLNQ